MVGQGQYRVYDFRGDPFEIFRLVKDEPFAFFLDSSLSDGYLGRYSLIGFDPFEIFEGKSARSLEDLKKRFEKFSLQGRKQPQYDFLPFTSGIVGSLSYDLGLGFENVVAPPQGDFPLPFCVFGFYDCAIVFDHLAGRLFVLSSGLPEKNKYLKEKKAQWRLENVQEKLEGYLSRRIEPVVFNAYENLGQEGESDFSCNLTREGYFKAVRRSLEYITRGDIYQVNLARRFLCNGYAAEDKAGVCELYSALRQMSPSCFGGYMDAGAFKILSSSPERFLKITDCHIETRPMKGTRRRGQNFKEDKNLKEELWQSPKDKAELLMITDLERNDLGRVCRYGSIKVKEMRTLEEYRTVFQTTSTVEGILAKDKDCFDALKACFPSGSVTGCPKIRSMEIIGELEGIKRGFYTGAMGFIDFSGNADFNILIRTLLLKDNKISFHVGSGIVSDSKPDAEYEETQIKARAMRQAVLSVLKRTEGVAR